jgi:2-polyprenyl-3-methyl-5-hydroxy-6-metoxy-1,4-benzoquinol methylase
MISDFQYTKGAYDAWHERLSVDSFSDAPWHRLVKKNLVLSRDLESKRVLEIGCGRGGFAAWLARQAESSAQIVAADFSDAAIQKGRIHAEQLGLSGISWEIEDIQDIHHSDGSFDTVISCETIEHVPNPAQAVRELARVLKPGGRLFVTTPNYLGTMGLYRLYCRLRGRPYTEEGQPINHLMLLPMTQSLVTRAGLKIETIDAVGHYLLFPGRSPVELPACNNPRIVMRWFALHSMLIAEKV